MKTLLIYPRRGFTLVEILISLTIIGILALIITSSAGIISRNARDTQRVSNLKKIQSALEQYHSDQGFYPNSLNLHGNLFTTLLTNCTGNYDSGCTVSRTYLKQIPRESSDQYNSSGAAIDVSNSFCYRPAVSYQSNEDTSTVPSCGQQPPDPTHPLCQYYVLTAHMEGNGADTTACNDGLGSSVNKNYELTPSNQ